MSGARSSTSISSTSRRRSIVSTGNHHGIPEKVISIIRILYRLHSKSLLRIKLDNKKRPLLRCIHHFKSDWINNMDHMRISGTEPSSVILSQKCISKVEKRCLKRAKTSWSQKGWCNKPTKLQFQTILTRKILLLSNATNQPKSIVELGYMCPRGLTGPPAVTLTK